MTNFLPVTENHDQKGYLRCCIACRQPWNCNVNSVGDLNTYFSYMMQAYCNRISSPESNATLYYFAAELEICHIIQKAHQSSALSWICDDNFDFTRGVATIIVDPKEWESKSRVTRFRGVWNVPDYNVPEQIIKHRGLRRFLFGGEMLHFDGEEYSRFHEHVLPSELIGCKMCNNVMDTSAKLRRTLYGDVTGSGQNRKWVPGIIPPGLINMGDERNIIGFQSNVMPAPTKNGFFTKRIACLCAWYLHSSFIYLFNQPGLTYNDFQVKRKFAAVLSYLTLLVYTHWYNLNNPEDGVRKPNFTYKGLLNLYISLHQYMCVCAEFPRMNLSFPKFHTFYFLEIAECNYKKLWKTDIHKLPHEFLMRRLNPTRDKKYLIESISDRLIQLYTKRTRKIIQVVFYKESLVRNMALTRVIQKFFISEEELNSLYAHLPECTGAAQFYNLQSFIKTVGITGILGQCTRLIATENKSDLTNALYQWMRYMIKNFEHKNIAMNGKVNGMILSLEEAVIAYNYQYLMTLPNFFERHGNMYQILSKYDLTFLWHSLALIPRCSIFKAAYRLSQYDFTNSEWRKKYA